MNRRIVILVIIITAVIAAVFVSLKLYVVNKKNQEKNKKTTTVLSLAGQALALEEKGNLIEARNLYQRLVNESPDSANFLTLQKKIEGLNIRIIFSPIMTTKSKIYEIKPGDTLIKIASQFSTTVELLMKSNNLSSDRIVPNKKIKINTETFSVFVDKSQNILLLKSGEDVVKTYIVSTGANNSSPVGNFKIVNKIVSPTWFKAGAVVAPGSPENVLGTRWMGIDAKGYGLHGTVEPQQLGKQVTEGCVRLANSDVEELYDILPVGTEVVIVD